jgi:hypothetical protein
MNESQKYHHLMLAFHGLADGMTLTDRIQDTENDGYGLKFGIDASSHRHHRLRRHRHLGQHRHQHPHRDCGGRKRFHIASMSKTLAEAVSVIAWFRAPVELDGGSPFEWIRRLPEPLPFLRFFLPVFHFVFGDGSPLATHDFQRGKLAF